MKSLTYIPFFLSLILFTSCEQVITIQLPNVETFVVVNSSFTPEEEFEIQLNYSNTQADGNDDFSPIEDAEVKIYNGQGQWLIDFYHAGDGKYLNLDGTKPYENQIYRLEVKVDGYPTITAESLVPAKAEIENLSTTVITNDDESLVLVDFDINEVEDEDNYYIWEVVTKEETGETDQTDQIITIVQGMQSNSNGESVQNSGTWSKLFAQGMDILNSLSSVAVIGTTSSANGNSDGNGEPNSGQTSNLIDELELRVVSASSDYYNYLLSLELIKNNSEINGSAAIPIEVDGNIVGGYGIFAGYNVQRESLQ